MGYVWAECYSLRHWNRFLQENSLDGNMSLGIMMNKWQHGVSIFMATSQHRIHSSQGMELKSSHGVCWLMICSPSARCNRSSRDTSCGTIRVGKETFPEIKNGYKNMATENWLVLSAKKSRPESEHGELSPCTRFIRAYKTDSRENSPLISGTVRNQCGKSDFR